MVHGVLQVQEALGFQLNLVDLVNPGIPFLLFHQESQVFPDYPEIQVVLPDLLYLHKLQILNTNFNLLIMILKIKVTNQEFLVFQVPQHRP